MLVIVDRFEGNFAICECEDRSMIEIEKEKLPKEAKEGDVLRIENDVITVDIEETKKRKERIEALLKDMWN